MTMYTATKERMMSYLMFSVNAHTNYQLLKSEAAILLHFSAMFSSQQVDGSNLYCSQFHVSCIEVTNFSNHYRMLESTTLIISQ